MSNITRPNSYSPNTLIQSAQVNADFNTIYQDYDGNITNFNIAAGAAIVASKLNLATIAQIVTMSGTAINFAKGGDIASATTTNIGAGSGNFIHITGTTTITAFDTIQSGTLRWLVFDGALLLTYNATSLILPTAANITTAANDSALFVSEGSGNWRCLSYARASGSPLGTSTGATVQIVNVETGAYPSVGTTAIPDDDTIPQITEGTEFMTLAITPTSATNKLKIDVVFCWSTSSSGTAGIALFQDATANALAAAQGRVDQTEVVQATGFSHYMTAGTTSATTFRVRAGVVAGNIAFNGHNGGRIFGGVMASSITITEIKV